jgi:hypothetical protein
MAFNGTLLQFGADKFPSKWIQAESYIVTPERRLDLDSGVNNANGVLQRNVLEHRATTISFSVRDGMFEDENAELWAWIAAHYIIESEQKVRVTYYSPKTNTNLTGDFYIPDVEFPIYYVDSKHKKIQYRSYTIELIEY